MSEYIVEFGDRPINDDNKYIREEIVRCRDCKYWIPFGIGNPKPDCWASGEPFKTEPGSFCAWGERKEGRT